MKCDFFSCKKSVRLVCTVGINVGSKHKARQNAFVLFTKALEISNEKLEDEKSQLYEQLHILVQQNHELLTQALASKDVYFEQNKLYT
jgi:hypothetical protein